MKAAFIVGAGVSLFITLPVWLFLQYKILELIGATELMWFLFWCYVPLVFIMAIVSKIAEAEKD